MKLTERDKRQARRLLAYLRHRPVITEAAEHAKVPVHRVRTWREKFPGFAAQFEDALAEGKATRAERYASEVYRRGVEGIDKPVWHMGRQVGTERVYSDSCLLAGAKAYIPEFNVSRVENKSEVKQTGDFTFRWLNEDEE